MSATAPRTHVTTRRGGGRSPEWLAARVRLAAKGDGPAWSEIVDEFEEMLRAVARARVFTGPARGDAGAARRAAA